MTSETVCPTAVITGASAGIGSELVPFFAGTGHNVVLVGKDKPVLEGIAAAARKVFRVAASVIACDLSEPDGARAVFAELQRREIEVEVLVNHAGVGNSWELAQKASQAEEQILLANVVSLTELTKLLLPGMTARGRGKILNVASTGAFSDGSMNNEYEATRAYVLSFSERLAQELKGTGVTVTSLCPDATEADCAGGGAVEDGRGCEKRAVSFRSMARAGFRALIRGDRVALPGWSNLAMTSRVA